MHKPVIDLSVSSSFFDKFSNDVKEYDFVESVISFYHESYHAMQLMKNPGPDDDVGQLISYTSRFYNDETYKKEYHKFSFEIAAERYALKQTVNSLSEMFSDSDLDNILLDYVNAKATAKTSEYKYFISSDSGFTNLNEAYAKSYEEKKNFKHIQDCVGKALLKDNVLHAEFDKMPNGREQARFAAHIVINKHPELLSQQRNLKQVVSYINDVRECDKSDYSRQMPDDFDINMRR